MKIISVHASLLIFDGDISWDSPSELQLSLDDGSVLRLRCAHDGESLAVDSLSLHEPADLGEYGRFDVFDFFDKLDTRLRNQEVGPLRKICNPDGKLIGIAIPTSEDRNFCICNCGDEFYWGYDEILKSSAWDVSQLPTIGEVLPIR